MMCRQEAMKYALEAGRIRQVADTGALIDDAKKIEAYLKGDGAPKPRDAVADMCHGWATALENLANAANYPGQRQSLRDLAVAIRAGRP